MGNTTSKPKLPHECSTSTEARRFVEEHQLYGKVELIHGNGKTVVRALPVKATQDGSPDN